MKRPPMVVLPDEALVVRRKPDGAVAGAAPAVPATPAPKKKRASRKRG